MWELEEKIIGSFWGTTDTTNTEKLIEVGIHACWD